jgi:hypothetical protein
MKAKASSGKTARARPAQVYSTSEARANFAEALEAASKDGAVIGFGRYGHTVAALVPLEAIYILAGAGDRIAPLARERIERGAKNLVQEILPNRAQPQAENGAGKSSFLRAGLKPKLAPAAKRKRRSES